MPDPPDAETIIEVKPPNVVIFPAVAFTTIAVGWVIVIAVVVLAPFASVTV